MHPVLRFPELSFFFVMRIVFSCHFEIINFFKDKFWENVAST